MAIRVYTNVKGPASLLHSRSTARRAGATCWQGQVRQHYAGGRCRLGGCCCWLKSWLEALTGRPTLGPKDHRPTERSPSLLFGTWSRSTSTPRRRTQWAFMQRNAHFARLRGEDPAMLPTRKLAMLAVARTRSESLDVAVRANREMSQHNHGCTLRNAAAGAPGVTLRSWSRCDCLTSTCSAASSATTSTGGETTAVSPGASTATATPFSPRSETPRIRSTARLSTRSTENGMLAASTLTFLSVCRYYLAGFSAAFGCGSEDAPEGGGGRPRARADGVVPLHRDTHGRL